MRLNQGFAPELLWTLKLTDPFSMPFSSADRLTSQLAVNPSILQSPRGEVLLRHPSTLIVHGPAILVALFHFGSVAQSFTGVRVTLSGCGRTPMTPTRARRAGPSMFIRMCVGVESWTRRVRGCR